MWPWDGHKEGTGNQALHALPLLPSFLLPPPPDKTRCPDVLGAPLSAVSAAGNASSTRPRRRVLGSHGRGGPQPRGNCHLRSENLPAQMPSTRRSALNLSQEPYLLGSEGDSEAGAGRARGQVWWPPQGQVCAAGNALPEEMPSKTPRPFHYKLLHFNPLLETMQTLIQKKKKYKCNKNLRVNTIPGISPHCSHPRPGLAGTPLHRLASPLPLPSQAVRGGGRWPVSCLFKNFHT